MNYKDGYHNILEEKHRLDSNHQHLIHYHEGYSTYIKKGVEAVSPYSPGGARDISWQEGRDAAEKDIKG